MSKQGRRLLLTVVLLGIVAAAVPRGFAGPSQWMLADSRSGPAKLDDPSRLVRLYEIGPYGSRHSVSPAAFLNWRDQNVAFDELAAMESVWMRLPRERGQARLWVRGARVSPNFFSVLGVPAALGRAFDDGGEQPADRRVAVVSHDFWEQRLAGDPWAIGQKVELNGREYTVIGVMPDRFFFPHDTQVWIPLAFDSDDRASRRRSISAIGRLADYATLEQARAELEGIMHRLGRRYPHSYWGWSAEIVPLIRDGGTRVRMEHIRTLVAASGAPRRHTVRSGH